MDWRTMIARGAVGAVATAIADLKRFRESRKRGDGLGFDWLLFGEQVLIGFLMGALLGGAEPGAAAGVEALIG